MLAYERIDISDGIDVNKSDKSKECMLCHYWYFLDKSFTYGPHLCDGCYKNVINLKILLLLILQKLYTELVFRLGVNAKQEN